MLARTWPYGTRKRIVVKDVLRDSGTLIGIELDVKEPEGFILAADRAVYDGKVKKDDVGEIVFTSGGPTGGFWKYVPLPDKT